MRLGRAGAIAAARRQQNLRNSQQELAIRAARAGALDIANEREQQSMNSSNQIGNSGREDAIEEQSSREEPGTGSIIKGSSKHDMSAGVVIPVADNINVKSSSRDKIVFRRYPCTLWTTGLFVCLCALYLIYHLSLGPKHGTLFEGYKEGYVTLVSAANFYSWQALVAICSCNHDLGAWARLHLRRKDRKRRR